jgi:hypothetical protein
MYLHIEQAAEINAEDANRFLIEGFELAPWYPRGCRPTWTALRPGASLIHPGHPRSTLGVSPTITNKIKKICETRDPLSTAISTAATKFVSGPDRCNPRC